MTVEAPIHVKRVFTPHERHLVHPTVTSGAADTLVNVNAVVEVDEAGQIVYARPLNRLARAITLSHRFQNRTVRPDLGVAIHAGLGGWNTCKRTFFHRGVAIPTVDAVIADMMFVTEGHRLATRDADIGDVRRFIDRRESRRQPYNENDAAKNGHSGDGIGARMKNLSHRLSLSCWPGIHGKNKFFAAPIPASYHDGR